MLTEAGGEFTNESLVLVFEWMKFLAKKSDWDEEEKLGYRLLLEREKICLAALAQDVPINSAPLAQDVPINSAPLFGVLSA